MEKFTRIVLLIFLIFSITYINAQTSYAVSDKEFNRAIENISREHPRLYLQRKNVNRIKDKLDEKELFGKAFHDLKESAEEMLDNPVPKQKDGVKIPTTGFKRITTLGFLYRITGEQKYVEAAKRDLFAIANWEDWYPRNYLKTSRATAAVGIGYDWFYDQLNDEEKKELRQAIVEKGFKTAFNGQWWVYCNHNWNSVNHGSLVMAALAILKEDESGMAEKTLKRAINAFPILLQEYGPDGAYHEGGPGYYSFATEYAIKMITALESALGTDFGFKNYDGFLESAYWYLHLRSPAGYYFNTGDNASGRRREGVYDFFPGVFWFESQLDDPALLWHQKPMLKKVIHSEDRTVPPFFFFYQKGNMSMQKPGKSNWVGHGQTPVGFHRTGWDKNDTYMAIKGGTPGTNHGHMDIGSFVIDAMGERWAMDPGGESYTKLESAGLDIWNMNQTSDRWKVFRYNNRSHNTLVVDDKLQRVPGKGRLVDYSFDYDFSYSIIDMHKVYQGLIGNNPTVRRGMGLYKDGSIIIQDELKGKAKRTGSTKWGMDIRWQMMTPADVEIVNDQVARLTQNGKEMWLHLLAPNKAELEIESTEPPHEYDADNEGTRMVVFKARLDTPIKIKRLAVYLHPHEKAEDLPEVKSLYDWK